MSVQNKPWYRKWWGVIIAILILPYFLLWFVWAKTRWNRFFKGAVTIVLGVFCLLYLAILLHSSGSNSASPKNNNPTLEQLNAQAASILTEATNNTAQLMASGQNDALQKDALSQNPESSFEKWRKTVQNTDDANTNNAYNSAAKIYTNAGKPIPGSLMAWKKDNFAAYADASLWQLSETTLLVAEQGGSTSPTVQSNQATTQSDYTGFLTDLGKAQSDISKLSGKPFVSTVKLNSSSQATAPKPTVSLATLNSQAMQTLTTATNHYSQLMTTAQSDAAQGDAATNYNSAFKVLWRSYMSNVDKTAINAYNSADNAYYDAHQNAPDALGQWDTDIEQVYTDITTYVNDQEQVFGDQQTSNDASSDQAKVTTDLKTYNSDLAKAKADINKI